MAKDVLIHRRGPKGESSSDIRSQLTQNAAEEGRAWRESLGKPVTVHRNLGLQIGSGVPMIRLSPKLSSH